MPRIVAVRAISASCALMIGCANEIELPRQPAAIAPQSRSNTSQSTTSARYVGSRTCAACHTSQYLWWLQTDHGTAYTTLIERGREHDPKCIGCHVTGFNQPSGARIGHTDELAGVGCESCHGPGGAHADAPNASPLPADVAAATCLECHTDERSDDFVYADAKAELSVPGHGANVRSPPAPTPQAPSRAH